MNSSTEETRTIAGVVLFNPIGGLFEKADDRPFPLIEPTEYVPNVSGQLFGCVFEYVNDTGRIVPYRWELVLPGAPDTAATIDGTTMVYRIADKNRVVNHSDGLFPGQSTQYSVNRIDPGDPSGKWLMELFVADILFEMIPFYLFAMP